MFTSSVSGKSKLSMQQVKQILTPRKKKASFAKGLAKYHANLEKKLSKIDDKRNKATMQLSKAKQKEAIVQKKVLKHPSERLAKKLSKAQIETLRAESKEYKLTAKRDKLDKLIKDYFKDVPIDMYTRNKNETQKVSANDLYVEKLRNNPKAWSEYSGRAERDIEKRGGFPSSSEVSYLAWDMFLNDHPEAAQKLRKKD